MLPLVITHYNAFEWIFILIILAGFAFLYSWLFKQAFFYIIFPVFWGIPTFLIWHYVDKNPELSIKNRKYVAIVLANDYYPWRFVTYSFRIDKIIRYLKKKNKPYKVFTRITPNKLKEITEDKMVKGIILFGHGQKHGIKLSKKKVFYYCEAGKSPKKEFVMQFHCNHYGGTSLVDYIGKDKDKCFVNDKENWIPGINKVIRNITKAKSDL